jgi:hypothetical protein
MTSQHPPRYARGGPHRIVPWRDYVDYGEEPLVQRRLPPPFEGFTEVPLQPEAEREAERLKAAGCPTVYALEAYRGFESLPLCR